MAQPLNAAVTDGLLHDTSALAAGAELRTALDAFVAATAGAFGAAIGSFAVPASRVEEFRPLTDPDGHTRIAIVADEGLLALKEAREAVQDDVWLVLDQLRIALPPGFAPDVATGALLEELSFTVPTYVELPRTGYEMALDVLAADGVERAGWNVGDDLPADGELAAFVHGCVIRRVPFLLTAGVSAAVRAPGAHGVLNVLAATAAALDGATTSEVAEIVATHDAGALIARSSDAAPLLLRDLFHGVGLAEPARVVENLTALEALDPSA